MTRHDPIKYVFIWPALLIVLAISIFPLIYSLTTSFMSFRLMPPTPPRFVGFDNYWSLLQNERFWSVALTTSIIAFISVASQYAIGFADGRGHYRGPTARPMRIWGQRDLHLRIKASASAGQRIRSW